jgi:transposase
MYFLGIDVSKVKIDCCVFLGAITSKKKSKVFANAENGFSSLLAWLIKLDIDFKQTTVVLEATSVYHESLAYRLHDAGLKVCIANPARVRRFAEGLSFLNKTDKADSEALARFAALAEPEAWQPPSPKIRLIKALMARREVLSTDLQRELNRLEKATSTQTPLQVLASINGSISFIKAEIAKLDQEIKDHIDHDPELKNDLDLLTSIPAIGERTGMLMLGLLHSHEFSKASQVAAYVGLVPVQHQSGSSVRGRSSISKAGSAKVRAGLYMAAVVAIKHNPHIKAMYARLLLNGKSKMAGVCAAMRKLVHLCYGVLKHQMPYQANYGAELA